LFGETVLFIELTEATNANGSNGINKYNSTCFRHIQMWPSLNELHQLHPQTNSMASFGACLSDTGQRNLVLAYGQLAEPCARHCFWGM